MPQLPDANEPHLAGASHVPQSSRSKRKRFLSWEISCESVSPLWEIKALLECFDRERASALVFAHGTAGTPSCDRY